MFPSSGEGGIAAFRCFRFDPRGGYLESLVASYTWKPGVQEADAIPESWNRNGLWGFKTLPEAIYQEGGTDDRIFALTEHWDDMIEGEIGLRSRYAEIMAFIEPVRPSQLAVFPRKALAQNYPDVPVIHQRDIAAKIAELEMVTLPKAAPPALMQWLGPDGPLVWARETLGPRANGEANGDEYEMLPAAASYPDETHPADQRLRKVRVQDAAGDRYELWELLGSEASAALIGHGFATYANMYRHRVASGSDEGG
jgi:hypothetical protein